MPKSFVVLNLGLSDFSRQIFILTSGAQENHPPPVFVRPLRRRRGTQPAARQPRPGPCLIPHSTPPRGPTPLPAERQPEAFVPDPKTLPPHGHQEFGRGEPIEPIDPIEPERPRLKAGPLLAASRDTASSLLPAPGSPIHPTPHRLGGMAVPQFCQRGPAPENTVFAVKRLIGKKFNDLEVQRDLLLLPYKARLSPLSPYDARTPCRIRNHFSSVFFSAAFSCFFCISFFVNST